MMKVKKPKIAEQQLAVFGITPSSIQDRIFDAKDEMSPFFGYVGNQNAVASAMDIAKAAFQKAHLLNDIPICLRLYPVRMLLKGPKSVGKTTFARNYGAIISIKWDKVSSSVSPSHPMWALPWAEVDATRLKNREEIFSAMEVACLEKNLPLVPEKVIGGVKHYNAPVMSLFVDEIHALSSKLMDGMLKMTEANDGIFEVGSNIKVNCKRVTVIGGTTKPGDLDKALLSRFPVKLDLKIHTVRQVALMIKNKFSWHSKYCIKLAEMKSVPREALEIAKLIEDSRQHGLSLKESFDRWVNNLGLREGGLEDKAMEVLSLLADARPFGLSMGNLCVQLQIEKEEFQQQLMPQLLKTALHPAYITVAGRHKITDAGIQELNKRGVI